jgi:AraC-like DNA-binding protein
MTLLKPSTQIIKPAHLTSSSALEPTAGTALVALLLGIASSRGISTLALAEHLGRDLSAVAQAGPQARLPLVDLLDLCAAVEQLSAEPAIGLWMAGQVRPATFNVLGYALMTCRTLGEALNLVPHYRQLVLDEGYSETVLQQTQNEAARLPYSPHLAEILLCAWNAFGSWITGRDTALHEVRFAHPARHAQAAVRYSEFFDCPVHFDADVTALVFSSDDLLLPLPQADDNLHMAMREQARAALRRIAGGTGSPIGIALRQSLLPLMPRCEATLHHAARALAMPPRTLQRQLAQAGTGFQSVLDEVRRELACVYLKDPSIGLLDVALLLGYAEQSSFTRAFRAWYGRAPSTWRILALEGAVPGG